MRILFEANETIAEQIKKLKEKYGVATNAEMIRRAISLWYEKTYPAHIYRPKKRIPGELPPLKLSKKEIEEREGRNICAKLGGKVISQNEGNAFACVYTVYERYGNRIDQFETTASLRLLSEDLVKMQYQPSKEECMEIIKTEH